MLIIGIRRSLVNAGWRCLHQDSCQILTKRKVRPKTSGIIVTGDEVLKGQVLDTNSHFLCKKLYEMGIKVVAISKVPDIVDKISEEVMKFSQMYDYVITTGGIGPTHDDVTYEAVAKAFNDKLYHHPEISKSVLDYYKTNDINHPALKMAYIPTSSKLTYGIDPVTKIRTLYPNISVQNVFTFPGVPHWCERIFNLAGDKLFKSTGKFFMKNLYLTSNEGTIVDELNNAVKKYPNILFGSYPKFFHSYYSVKISAESIDESEVAEGLDYLKQLIPKEFHVDFDENPFVDKRNKLSQYQDSFLIETLRQLRFLIESNNPNDLYLYFDGGKNSTVLLLIMSVLYEELCPNCNINGIYVELNPKINGFVMESTKNFKLNLLRFNESNFKNFANSSPKICVIKGTRKSDPNISNILKFFEGLDVVNPLFHWNYKNVWKIIRGLYLPYCELYDQGYTSICQRNPVPNSNLRTTGPRKDYIYYKKAFELTDETLENAH